MPWWKLRIPAVTVPESKKKVAAQYRLTREQLDMIEKEGLDKDWPPLAPRAGHHRPATFIVRGDVGGDASRRRNVSDMFIGVRISSGGP